MKTPNDDDEKFRFSQVEEKEYADQRRNWNPAPKTAKKPFWETLRSYWQECRLVWEWRTSNTKDDFWEWRRKREKIANEGR